VLDFSIVNVALPSIQAQFHLSPTELQWVVSAYALTFGGFLLLGGRLSDLFSRKRMFLAGLALFSLASVLGGLAPSAALVFLARAVQGLGAAVLSPSALSLITTTFPEGGERDRALGIFGSMAALGFTLGIIIGGALTSFISWHWVFFVNVPIGVIAFIVGVLFIPKPSAHQAKRGFDVTGAVLVTASILIAVYAITLISVPGESLFEVPVLLLLSFFLGACFIFVERRISRPLVPLDIFRRRTIVTADTIMFIAYWSNAALVFIITLYLQEVRGLTPLETGVVFVPAGLGGITGATLAPRIVKRTDFRYLMLFGLLLYAAGILGLSTISTTSSLPVLSVIYVFTALGIVSTLVSLNIAGTTGVEAARQGLAAGLLTTAQQIGAAIGVSVASVVISVVTVSSVVGPSASVEAYRSAIFVSLGLTVVAVLLALYLVRRNAKRVRAAGQAGPASPIR
jgi:EmrB/QacA subfamily drug resistance transporter